MVCGGRMRDNGCKLKQERFRLDINRNFFTLRQSSSVAGYIGWLFVSFLENFKDLTA